MTPCSFQRLVQLLDDDLDIDTKLEVLDHVDSCGICRDAVYQISRDRDEDLFVRCSYNSARMLAQEAQRSGHYWGD